MAKSLELATFAAVFLAIFILTSMLHYSAGYGVNDVTIWAIGGLVGVVGFAGCSIAAIFEFANCR